jgi:phage host-nuclease inhibitor protein Gam
MQDFEKLGLFYLGRSYDHATQKAEDDLILYDARDLVTHAVCVGMTGSGKTGLCISLLEEAIIDHVPAIAIDPKGDLSNLLLTFPELRGTDFAPWVDAGEAGKEGRTLAEFAEAQAALWKKGLADWGQDGARIARLRQSGEFRIYTPGSQAGLPISILKSFAAPPQAIRDDAEALGERVGTTATSLLGLLGVDADSMQSREHILISTILSSAWKAGNDLELAALIGLIQNPPFSRVGVIDLESFFPAKDRFALALRLNNLLAAPGFEMWLQGEPLDIGALLYAPDGKPRVSVVSIAHLGEAERMFFVALLLNEVLGWVRSQPGTTSLRALLYMDEIFGYFPPVATPPSKRPLLTLLKQARAYGLGVVLATQNPADLDYKGLSNTGTWFIGRLQAERDKLRVLEGLDSAAAAQSARFDRQEMDKILSGLGKRTFLMHNVHEDHPQVFQVRWALSYLRGPLTRQQIKTLMDPVRPMSGAKVQATGAVPARAAADTTSPALSERPLLPPEVPQFFVPPRGKQPPGSALLYRPMILGAGDVHFSDTKSGVSSTSAVALLAELPPDALTVDWSTAAHVELTPGDLEREPEAVARFEPLAAAGAKAKSYTAWSKSFVDALYRGETLELRQSPSLGAWSKPSEPERDFRIRLQQAAKEARDAELERLRAKYAPKLAALQARIQRAEQAVTRESSQAWSAGLSSLVRVGTTILDAVVGRKMVSATTINKAGTAIRDVGKTVKETGDVSRAQDTVESLREQRADLEAEFAAESAQLAARIDPMTESLETVTIRPKKTNITAKLVALAWTPRWAQADGTTTAAWE